MTSPATLIERSLALPSWHGLGAHAGGRRARRVLLVILALLLAAMTIADLVLVRSADQRDAIALSRAEALAETKTRLPDLLGYSYETLDADLARANQNTTGKFRDDYAKVLNDVVAPTASAQKTRTQVEVNDAAVVSATVHKVVVLAFLTQTTTAGGGTPTISGSRVEVSLEEVGSRWLIAGLMPL